MFLWIDYWSSIDNRIFDIDWHSAMHKTLRKFILHSIKHCTDEKYYYITVSTWPGFLVLRGGNVARNFRELHPHLIHLKSDVLWRFSWSRHQQSLQLSIPATAESTRWLIRWNVYLTTNTCSNVWMFSTTPVFQINGFEKTIFNINK